ncbi:MAG: 4Fe-4S dicluster domain-containing protein [Planctomycetes bacterium]|nr:4Fe-4S dicluster domain-containing protein [Planctomycetota bacterium]
MQYGFLIDHRRCIGCHACTVACKSENDVPIASFRTWVKYQEKGRFPAVKRHFAVLRCNHCTKAPCVTICPVNALSKRKDGIVDLDRDACIGCRACMQGCPYDAIYLNEDTGAAEKCHFCAHRVEKGLEPACVVVCPEGAIIAGDLHEPSSRIAQMVDEFQGETLQRRTEQGTGPNVHYLGIEPTLLKPGEASRPDTYLWSDRPPHKLERWPADLPLAPDTRTVLDAGHKVEWGWHVAAYLVTKGIAAGAAILAPIGAYLGLEGFAADWAPEILALVFLVATLVLLVHDLARPMLFFRLLTRPNTKSWLVKGGWILGAFGATVTASLGARWFGFDAVADGLRWVNAALGLAVAGYTAFLFKQCEGRDLWQGNLVLPHLIVQALLCGSAALLPFSNASREVAVLLAGSLVVHSALMLLELRQKHSTDNARQAAAFLPVAELGAIKRPFALANILGVAVPALLIALASMEALTPGVPYLFALAALLGLAGLYLYESAFVRAGQLPPLS